ncbi:MAG: DUF2855 family protein [Burkholderiales bacterium]|nr:DUF2855 family protein [Burkholderiales bacterium]
MARHFTVHRDAPSQSRWSQSPVAPPAAGEAVLAVESFSFTANNVTYAMFGERMHYWDFFPTDDAAYGSIPVWGFARVVASAVAGLAVGERFYGYYPMSTHLRVWPERAGAQGFVDGTAHRAALPSIYNQYLNTQTDPLYAAGREPEQAVLRPLFATSFLLDDFLADNAFFGATRVVLSSASSKTAYGTAARLAARGGIEVIGLTSPANAGFVRSLECYTQVQTYDQLGTLDPAVRSVYCDFAGNAALRAQFHEHCGDALAYSCSIGGTHWDALGGAGTLPGPRPVLFFAPAQARKRSQEWGIAVFQRRLAEAWQAFLAHASNPSAPWLTVVLGQGEQAIARTTLEVMAGQVSPRLGHVLSF